MKAYKDWSPTGLDCKGLALDDRRDWLVAPVSINRDSDALERSNWRVVVQDMTLRASSDNWEIHRFGHWACGWFKIMIVHPNSPARVVAEEWEAALENYPVASDDDFSNEEYEEANEV